MENKQYTAKDLRVAPISRADADRIVKRLHYSGKIVPNAQLHFGVFLGDRLEGAMQFGPSMDKRKTLGLVRDTTWNGFLELNRMAFSDRLPRNSESRAMAVAFRMIRSAYPHIEWIISFSDATQCGDGTIYRASGFKLCGLRKNKTIWQFPDGECIADIGIKTGHEWQRRRFGKVLLANEALKEAKRLGAKPLAGFQLRYVYFLNPNARERLTVPVLPFSKVDEIGAGMYLGERVTRSSRAKEQEPANPAGLGGAPPTRTLQHSEATA
jgi:GNAT superfamily N-acetyltransferase